MPLSMAARAENDGHIRAFVSDNIMKIDAVHLDDLAINPYLVETMGLKTAEEIVDFFVNQRFQRAVVTSFGYLFEQRIAKKFGSAAGIKAIDLKFERKGKTFFVQLKSGPEGFTGTALEKTLDTMKQIKKGHPGSVPVVAFSYGTRDKLSKVWGRDLLEAEKREDVQLMVGREFWNFVLDDPKGYDLLFKVFEEAGVVKQPTLSGERRTLEDARKQSYARVLPEFKRRYGTTDLANKLKEDNL